LLARHFLASSAKQLGVEPKRLSDEALAHLSRLEFPGNVRQLENLCHWLTVMAPGQVIEKAELPAEFRDQAAAAVSDWLAALEGEAERRPARPLRRARPSACPFAPRPSSPGGRRARCSARRRTGPAPRTKGWRSTAPPPHISRTARGPSGRRRERCIA